MSSRPKVFYEKVIWKISQNLQGNTCARVSFSMKCPWLYWKRDFGTGVFLWILQNSYEQVFFYRTIPEAASVVKPYIDPCHRFFFRNLPGGRFPKQHIFMLYVFLRNKHNEFPQNTIIWMRLQKVTLQTHHVYTTLKKRGNDRCHVVSTWNIRGVFGGKDSPIFVYKCNKEENYFNLTH